MGWIGQHGEVSGEQVWRADVAPTVAACIRAVLGNPDSWIDGVTEAIRLGGDVDTTGAIVGAVLGARFGVEGIPRAAVRDVVARDGLIVDGHRLWAAISPNPPCHRVDDRAVARSGDRPIC